MSVPVSCLKLISLAIACLCLASVTSAQFTIKIPKIPKVEKPSSPNSSASPESSTQVRGSDISRGAAITGAKVYFSTTPFSGSNAGSRSSFTSQEFIYGRLELNRSISETFGLGNMPKRDYYYLKYVVFIGNEEKGIGPHTGNHLFVSKEDASKNYLNFDVWPDGSNVNTVLAVVDEMWNYKFPATLVSEHDVRSKLPRNGDYPVRVVLFQANFDDYGQPRFDEDPLPYAAGQFTFQFSAKDWNAMNENYKRAVDNAETARNKKDTRKTLPDWWGKNKAPADAKLSAARLTALLKIYAGKWDRVYLNQFAWDSYSPPVWKIQKDEYGLPSYRYAPYIWALYKDNKDGMCYYGSHSIREDYAGAGTYGQLYLNMMSDRTYVDCGAIR